MTRLRSLVGTRSTFLVAAAFSVIPVALVLDPVDLASPTLPETLLLLVTGAASTVQLVASIMWVLRVVDNQERLGHPVPGNVWGLVIVGSLVPFVGPLLLFVFADRVLRASATAARSAYDRPAWLVPWFVAYYVAATLGPAQWFVPALAARPWHWVESAFLAASWFGLARFLKTVEVDQETPDRTLPALPPLPEASPIPDAP